MRLPFRPKQQMKKLLEPDEPLYLTQEAIEKMKRRLKRIQEEELPQAIEDVRRTGEFGDFSENAEYQEAKGRMRRLRDQETSIQEKLKVAIEIQSTGEVGESVQLGSSVVLSAADGSQRTYQIVGPQEADPLHGRLSFKSPLGSRVMGRTKGEEVILDTPSGQVRYSIEEIH